MSHPAPNSNSWRAGLAKAWALLAAFLCRLRALFRTALLLPGAALVAIVLFFLARSCQDQERLRQAEESAAQSQQTTSEVARLKAQVAAELSDANERHAKEVHELESRRQRLEQEAESLRARLALLRRQEDTRAGEVATLPTTEVATRVAARLEEQVPGVGCQVLGSTKTETVGHGVNAEHQPPTEEPDTRHLAPDTLVLSDSGLRKVETAFVALDACRQQRDVLDQEAANCGEQKKLNAAVIAEQSAAIQKLNTAVADQKQILELREAEHRNQLKAARGTWRSRLWRAAQYVAAGFVAGVLVR